MNLSNLNLLSLQTGYMQKDKTTSGLCSALQPQLLQLIQDSELCSLMARIDHLNEKLLDELAWQMHVDFYTEVTLEQKRELVKTALIIHKTKGTPYAVETLITAVFGDGEVQEWFEYDGEPYTFKVLTSNASVTSEQASLFLKALDSVKNARSHLQEIIVALTGEMSAYFGGVVQTGDFITAEQVG